MRAFVETLPIGAFLFLWGSHALGCLAAGATSSMIAGRPWLRGAAGLGGLFMLAGIAMLFIVPHPVWFAVVDLLIYLPLALLGCWLAGRRLPKEMTSK